MNTREVNQRRGVASGYCTIMRFVTLVTSIAFGTVSPTLVWGQLNLAESGAKFEVATVKRSAPSGPSGWQGGPGTPNPGQYTYANATLRTLLARAYGLRDSREQVSGPPWIDKDRFDVVAKIPSGTTDDQFQLMLQNLLIERFSMSIHRDKKQLPVYQLVVAKNGPKLKISVDLKAQTNNSGFAEDRGLAIPPNPPGLTTAVGANQRSQWTGSQQSMQALARGLSRPTAAGRLVVDKTGLVGVYDFTLEYDLQPSGPASGSPDPPAGVSIFEAIERQLGLKLVSGNMPFDVIVIEKAERLPSEN